MELKNEFKRLHKEGADYGVFNNAAGFSALLKDYTVVIDKNNHCVEITYEELDAIIKLRKEQRNAQRPQMRQENAEVFYLQR